MEFKILYFKLTIVYTSGVYGTGIETSTVCTTTV